MISDYILHTFKIAKENYYYSYFFFFFKLIQSSNQYSQLKNNFKLVLNDMKMIYIESEISVFQESVFILY